jgi:toxin ParE1/3/4
MAEIVCSEPALSDLDAIADYIALEDPVAASELVKRIFGHVEQLADHPESGSRPQELGQSRYRQIVEPPCCVFYRHDGHKVFILYVMRTERLLRKRQLASRGKKAKILD